MKKPNSLLKYLATSAALLASSAYLFAPTVASAFTLIRGLDGAVTNIEDLNVSGVGQFDVEFIYDSYDNIYNGTFDFAGGAEAQTAAEAVIGALGTTEYTRANIQDLGFLTIENFFDGFLIPYFVFGRTVIGEGEESADLLDDSLDDSGLLTPTTRPRIYAKFSPSGPNPPISPTSTPEPTLILGFITLGGLMLGSKRKTKG
ncbi:MAG: PEP-CTERM sorting domain-containing protein [Okeania sp. SIO3B3]|nr:PEP-CTERM sorting domain-containing protein [Okeania sp. SIO3B3]